MLNPEQLAEISKMFAFGGKTPPFLNKCCLTRCIVSEETTEYPMAEFNHSCEVEMSKIYSQQIRNHDCMWSGRCTGNSVHSIPVTNKSSPSKQEVSFSWEEYLNPDYFAHEKPPGVRPKGRSVKRLKAPRESLLKSRLKVKKPAEEVSVSCLSTSDFLKDREPTPESIIRPDTPLSLDDEPPQYDTQHTSDVSACTTGSQKTKLPEYVPTKIINLFKEHLYDESTVMIQNAQLLSFMNPSPQSPVAISELLNDISSLSDFDAKGRITGKDMINVSEKTVSEQSHESNQNAHSDHSYTRSKSRIGGLSVHDIPTPSDSDEEIDVVSIMDKTLQMPTNPSDTDRKALQSTVANAISSRIVQTPFGVRTIQPRRTCTSTSDNYNSVFMIPNDRPISNSRLSDSSSSSLNSLYSSNERTFVKHIPTETVTSIGKRLQANQYVPAVKSRRVKKQQPLKQQTLKQQPLKQTALKQQPLQQQQQQQSPRPTRRVAAEMDESEVLEKRKNHNNMERQRRIGLKHLFDALKDLVPSIQDKDRAPKVTILRESSILCRKYSKVLTEIDSLTATQKALYKRVSVLRTKLAARRTR